ncbi:hypothetical protein GCM10027563_28940 [Parasphingorhabdus pacifica]
MTTPSPSTATNATFATNPLIRLTAVATAIALLALASDVGGRPRDSACSTTFVPASGQ